MTDLSRQYIEQIASIYLISDQDTASANTDSLFILFKELVHIIFYGSFDDTITFSHKAYHLNMQVSGDDQLGFRIKNFITLYLNDVIETTLNK